MMIAGPPKPTQRPTAAAVAFVKSAPAGAEVGLFGFRLAVVMFSVLHATAPAITVSPVRPCVRPRSQVLFIDSSSVCGGELWGDLERDADAARRRHWSKFKPLCVSSVVRELRVDVRDVRLRPEITSYECDVDRLSAESVGETGWQIIANSYLAQLDVRIGVRVRLVEQPQRLEVLLRRHVDRVRLACRLVDSLDHDSGIVPVDLAAPQRVRAHSALIAHHVGIAEELTAHVEVEQKASGDALELELVVPAADPPWIRVAEHGRRSTDRKPLLSE